MLKSSYKKIASARKQLALNWKRANEQKYNLLMKNQRGRQSSCHYNRGPPALRVNMASACITSRTFSSPSIQRIVLSRIALKPQLRLTLLKKEINGYFRCR